MKTGYVNRLDTLIELAKKEMERTAKDATFHSLASMYYARFLGIRATFTSRYQKDLVAGFQSADMIPGWRRS